MRVSTFLLSLPLGLATAASVPECQFKPSPNATVANHPGAKRDFIDPPPYNLNHLAEVPVATICTSGDSKAELDCARKYIDAIDEQIAFLYARRLGYAAVAGHSKYRDGNDLNDPSRNGAVADGMAERVLSYGGNLETGRLMGGEGCQIYASLIYEAENIQDTCNPGFSESFTRVCDA